MLHCLPVTIDPLHLAEVGSTLCGRLGLRRMARLRPSLYNAEGEIKIALRFGKDSEGYSCLTGQLMAPVQVVCQRCSQPMQLSVEGDIRLGLVSSAEAAVQLPTYYEPLIVTEKAMSLAEIIEDELILALPLSPVHPRDVCLAGSAFEHEQAPPYSRPFDALSVLKHSHRTD